MKRRFAVMALVAAAATAWAAGIDRGLVEDGADATLANDATDSGIVLVKNNGTTRLRPATCSAGTCTRAAPSVGVDEGISMEEMAACRFMVCAPGLGYLTGAGKNEAWAKDPVTGRYGHMPAKDLTVTLSEGCQAWPVEPNDMQAAGVRLLYRPNAVGVIAADGGVASGALITSLQCCRASSGQLPFRGPGCGP